MVEGGAMIITNVLADRLADQLLVTICPRIVGGFRAVQTVHDFDHELMPCVSNNHFQLLAGDLIVRGDLQRDNGQARQPQNGQCMRVPPKGV
jgi:riboflavin biosynthesis pyrimidine reductase